MKENYNDQGRLSIGIYQGYIDKGFKALKSTRGEILVLKMSGFCDRSKANHQAEWTILASI